MTAVSIDGYDGSVETIFTTAEASADKLESYILEHLDVSIDLVFGESFGSATAGILFHRQSVQAGSMILSGPQYMKFGPEKTQTRLAESGRASLPQVRPRGDHGTPGADGKRDSKVHGNGTIRKVSGLRTGGQISCF